MAVIKTRGAAAKAKPSTRKAAAKPAARKGATRKVAAKTTERTNRSSKTDLSQSQLNTILNPLSKASKSRNKNHDAWKEDVATVNELIVEALADEIPVNMIVEAADVSRQHVYKLINDIEEGKRTKDGLATGKPGRKPTTTKRSSTKAPARKIGRTASVKPSAGKKRVIRAR